MTGIASGVGSVLRAILDADGNPGAETILFNVELNSTEPGGVA
jgi:hypothetical protein